jgi:Putative peptidase family
MKNVNLTLSASALAFILAGADAQAYTWWKCGTTNVKWAANSVTLRASQVGFPSGNPYRTALGVVASRWSNTPSKMNYFIQYDEPGVGEGNGQSEVWWTAPPSISAPAYAKIWWNGSCQIVEGDVVFNNTVSYTPGTTKSTLTPYGGSYRPFRTTAMHELGHIQGLGHTNNVYSIMGQDWDHIHANGSTGTAYPGEDAVAGSVAVYGLDPANVQDLGVAHWRYTGASGAYSSHGRTRLFSSGNVVLPTVLGATEPTYRVNKGQLVKLEMTYENMGKTSPLTVKVGYYVSTNDLITTADTFLGSGTVTLYRGVPDTTNNTFLWIPSNLVSGQTYYLGAMIDYNGTVGEVYESNNATYLAIRIN